MLFTDVWHLKVLEFAWPTWGRSLEILETCFGAIIGCFRRFQSLRHVQRKISGGANGELP